MIPDSVDLRLIKALQADAKASLVKLGREVGMSALPRSWNASASSNRRE